PKYRYNCMRKDCINKEVEFLIKKAAEENGIIIKNIAVGLDHIHVHAALPFSMSPSKALMFLKGRSAYLIFRRFPNFRLRYPKGHFWSPGKFVRSMSDVSSAIVDTYIDNQKFDLLYEDGKKNFIDRNQTSLSSFM
ncbi:MAG TPA: IS200/IS605 family transposase, partial [Candidatus Bilamarchaeaceae archaeon]|nr:IS200/IS605 family transposase [Candidatus Bilamarchaeaceae archaeon]